MASYGLIAGVSFTEQRRLRPGMLCDLYVLRRQYDDDQHGIERKKEEIDYDEGDFAPITDEEED